MQVSLSLRTDMIMPLGKLLEKVELIGYSISLSWDGWALKDWYGNVIAGHKGQVTLTRADTPEKMASYKQNCIDLVPWLYAVIEAEVKVYFYYANEDEPWGIWCAGHWDFDKVLPMFQEEAKAQGYKTDGLDLVMQRLYMKHIGSDLFDFCDKGEEGAIPITVIVGGDLPSE